MGNHKQPREKCERAPRTIMLVSTSLMKLSAFYYCTMNNFIYPLSQFTFYIPLMRGRINNAIYAVFYFDIISTAFIRTIIIVVDYAALQTTAYYGARYVVQLISLV